EGRRPRHRVLDATAQGCANLAQNKPIEERELDGEPERDFSGVERLRVRYGNGGGLAEDLALAAGLRLLLGGVVHLLEHSGHGEQERGPERTHRREQLLRVRLMADLDTSDDREH